jgi:tetratricopeptide (TPR) repeat protein
MTWLLSESVRYAASCDCFVVGTSSKIATYPELEWRISTCLIERFWMFHLNISQLQCYVLMKIILKTFLNAQNVCALSSFMCKTVLLHCIENTEQNIWKRENLFTCLYYCLLELHSYVQNENCPHFIISDNNLMAGQFAAEEKRGVLQKLCDIIHSDGRFLLRISMDNISQRLQVKLSPIVHFACSFQTSLEIYEQCSFLLFINILKQINACLLLIFNYLSNDHKFDHKQIILKLKNVYYSVEGNRLEQLASRYLASFLCSTLGLIMASSIGQNIPVQYEALQWLTLGLNSDVTSGRLKLASMFYCVGDMNRAEFILRQTESRYNSNVVEHVCGCWAHPLTSPSAEFKRKCSDLSENCINSIASCCVKFMQTEVNCVPQELRYEMVRSTQDDMPYRSMSWMDYAAVDSLPYLYFLQYKTYGHLQRQQDQQLALSNLVEVIFSGRNFGHRETALNLLGQCMEQEDKPREALQCYMLSLQQRERNNAAKFHICYLLRKYASNM